MLILSGARAASCSNGRSRPILRPDRRARELDRTIRGVLLDLATAWMRLLSRMRSLLPPSTLGSPLQAGDYCMPSAHVSRPTSCQSSSPGLMVAAATTAPAAEGHSHLCKWHCNAATTSSLGVSGLVVVTAASVAASGVAGSAATYPDAANRLVIDRDTRIDFPPSIGQRLRAEVARATRSCRFGCAAQRAMSETARKLRACRITAPTPSTGPDAVALQDVR